MDGPSTILEHDGTPIRATVHRSRVADTTQAIIYLHGGGGVFGTRDDLPQPYIDLFTGSGYHVIALDYLLAPESGLDEILDVLHRTLLELTGSGGAAIDLQLTRWSMMGRSAGAFLAVQAIARLLREDRQGPVALLGFYGYGSLDDKAFWTENRYYAGFAQVDDRACKAALSSHKLTESSLSNRYSVYVYHRQRGTWPQAVLGDTPVSATIIPDDIFARFPPTMLIHSIYDPDVPFRCSKELARKIPQSTLVKVYESDQHDFDRDPSADTGKPIYRDAVAWLSTVLDG